MMTETRTAYLATAWDDDPTPDEDAEILAILEMVRDGDIDVHDAVARLEDIVAARVERALAGWALVEDEDADRRVIKNAYELKEMTEKYDDFNGHPQQAVALYRDVRTAEKALFRSLVYHESKLRK
jgi:hypothetical protein